MLWFVSGLQNIKEDKSIFQTSVHTDSSQNDASENCAVLCQSRISNNRWDIINPPPNFSSTFKQNTWIKLQTN